jgi:hypothetical protein
MKSRFEGWSKLEPGSPAGFRSYWSFNAIGRTTILMMRHAPSSSKTAAVTEWVLPTRAR